jgi:hypothetical protein
MSNSRIKAGLGAVTSGLFLERRTAPECRMPLGRILHRRLSADALTIPLAV